MGLQANLSPSRLLGSFDTLVPQQILMEVLDAYLGTDASNVDRYKENPAFLTDPLLSPLVGSDEQLRALPRLYLVPSGLDPLLDDSIQFARRLVRLGVDVRVHVADELTHGFLNFFGIGGPEVRAANEHCIRCLQEIFTPGKCPSTGATDTSTSPPATETGRLAGPAHGHDSTGRASTPYTPPGGAQPPAPAQIRYLR